MRAGDDLDLAELRRDVVEPVLAELFRPGELTDVTLGWRVDAELGGWLVVDLVAARERLHHEIAVADEPDAAELRSWLADWLEGALPVTQFAWGQWRTTRFSDP